MWPEKLTVTVKVSGLKRFGFEYDEIGDIMGSMSGISKASARALVEIMGESIMSRINKRLKEESRHAPEGVTFDE